MPRFIIHCSTSKSYWLTVEAPNAEAVHTFYEGCDGDEFHEGDEGGWMFHEVEQLPASADYPIPDISIDDSGEVINDK